MVRSRNRRNDHHNRDRFGIEFGLQLQGCLVLGDPFLACVRQRTLPVAVGNTRELVPSMRHVRHDSSRAFPPVSVWQPTHMQYDIPTI